MADAAAARPALRDAHRIPRLALGPRADRLASDRRLGTAGDPRRNRPLRPATVPGAHLRPTLTTAILRCALRRQHHHPGEGPAHVPAAAPDGPAQLRNRPWKTVRQSVANRPAAGGHDTA